MVGTRRVCGRDRRSWGVAMGEKMNDAKSSETLDRQGKVPPLLLPGSQIPMSVTSPTPDQCELEGRFFPHARHVEIALVLFYVILHP